MPPRGSVPRPVSLITRSMFTGGEAKIVGARRASASQK
jgi:hypothetical protein